MFATIPPSLRPVPHTLREEAHCLFVAERITATLSRAAERKKDSATSGWQQ